MLFGFGTAAAAGFLLTAVPNWTKRLPVSGAPLAALFGLWLLGRFACATSALMPAWLAIVLDLAFPLVLIAVFAREIIAGKNWRNLPMTAPLTRARPRPISPCISKQSASLCRQASAGVSASPP